MKNLAIELGHMLARSIDLKSIARFRGDIAEELISTNDNSYEKGYLDALESVLAGYSAEYKYLKDEDK